MRAISKTLALLILFGLGTHNARAQAIAEAATLTANTTITAQSAKTPSFALATPSSQGTSPHLMKRSGPPPDELNRQDFEQNAGEKAGKLLLRSVPSGAEIFINDLLVGRTPLLLVIAPGKYKIDMRGGREESAQTIVGVMPKETQKVVLNLNQRYPSTIAMRKAGL